MLQNDVNMTLGKVFVNGLHIDDGCFKHVACQRASSVICAKDRVPQVVLNDPTSPHRFYLGIKDISTYKENNRTDW
jgi:hypothetical protein